jgi:uncharacterized protein YcbK (DUF882 family)
MILLGNTGLENAIANGDTRTLSLHHIHTEDDITITYKRDGRYDDEALKKLDWFVRDWRKDEEIHMDPRLLDLIWEVSREVGGDKVIHIVCGYRSPSTNAMLRRRSSGVAQFSQHTLGKAMDFYIPGASLEDLRYAGLRLQRGGVGYYPSSGSPFVHLDVGSIRHWPRMTHDQLARVFPDGRTVHIPSDGHPLAGYALALADIEKRGSSVPSQMSLSAAQAAGINTAAVHGVRKKSLLAALFNRDDDEENDSVHPALGAPASRAGSFSVASIDSRPEQARTATVPIPATRPLRFAAATAAVTLAADTAAPVAGGRDDWAVAGLTQPPRPPAPVQGPPRVPVFHPDTTAGLMAWPVREADNDRVPLDVVLAYATQPQRDRDIVSAARPEPMDEEPIRAVAVAPTKTAALRENVTAVPKKNFVRPAATGPVTRAKPVVPPAVNPGMRYDDPWLRAMIVAPSLSDSMTTTLYGEPDFTELRFLMNKPTTSVAMSFTNDPYPGITADRFSGEAVVFLNTYAFPQRTAWLGRVGSILPQL